MPMMGRELLASMTIGDFALDEAGEPAARVRRAPVLQVEQRMTDRARHRPHATVDAVVADHDLAALPCQPPHRSHDCCSTAGEDLGDLTAGRAITPLVDGDAAFFHLEAEVDRQLDDRGARHALQDLSLIHISEPTRRTPISYAVF